MYYGFYLFALAILVMIGQLAFTLYQAASFLGSWRKICFGYFNDRDARHRIGCQHLVGEGGVGTADK